jgi:hypothetical protein
MAFSHSKNNQRCDGYGGGLVCLGEGYLVVARVSIQEGGMDVSGMPCSGLCNQCTSSISHSSFILEMDLLSNLGAGSL